MKFHPTSLNPFLSSSQPTHPPLRFESISPFSLFRPLGYLFSVLTSLVYPIAPQLVSSIMDLSPSSLSSSMASSPLPFIQTSDTLLNKEKKNIWMSFSKFRDVVESLKKNSVRLIKPPPSSSLPQERLRSGIWCLFTDSSLDHEIFPCSKNPPMKKERPLSP